MDPLDKSDTSTHDINYPAPPRPHKQWMTSRNTRIRVGPAYQAVIPDLVPGAHEQDDESPPRDPIPPPRERRERAGPPGALPHKRKAVEAREVKEEGGRGAGEGTAAGADDSKDKMADELKTLGGASILETAGGGGGDKMAEEDNKVAANGDRDGDLPGAGGGGGGVSVKDDDSDVLPLKKPKTDTNPAIKQE